MVRLTINGKTHEVDVDPNTPLLWAIREQVGLTGTKYGCGVGQCGACTVHLNGAAVRACLTPGARGRPEDHHHRGPGKAASTVHMSPLDEARSAAMRLLPVGQLMAAAALLAAQPEAHRRG